MSGEQVPAPRGWNTWDVATHTGMVHLPSGLRARFGLLGEDGPVVDGFTWRDGLVRLGHHSVDGSFAEVTVEAAGTRLHLALTGGPSDAFYARAATTGRPARVLLILDQSPTPSRPEAGGLRSLAPEEPGQDHGWPVEVGGVAWDVSCSAAGRRVDEPDGGGAMWSFGGGAVEVRVLPRGVAGEAAADVLASRAEQRRLRSSGWLGDSADALTRAVTWNTIYAPGPGRVLTPTSRDFVSAKRRGFYGSWALHAWDTFFTGLTASVIDRDYARGIFAQILPHADASGMIPNRVSDDKGRTDDRSQPPVGALTVYRAYLAGGLSEGTRDRALLAATFPTLAAWHDWWLRARRGPHGLLAWGSDPVPGDPGSATLDRAKRESGLDDSPMYDAAVYDPATRTMDLADAGLNALHIADAEALAEIAALLGETAEADRLRAEAVRARRAADRLLWDAERGGYRNLGATGGHDPHVSPTLLYPLLAGVPDPERAAAWAAELLRSEALGGARPLPSVARNDPGFAATYWRGRIWAPMAYLAVEGLRRYGLTHLSRPVVDALLRLFLTEWREHSHVRENYPAHDGEDLTGLTSRSDGLMAWGGLLALLAFGELADARPDGWRFAHPGEPAELSGLPLGDGRLAVRATASRLRVELDGVPLLDASPGVVVRCYERTARLVTGIAEGDGEVLITPPGGRPVRLAVRGEPRPFALGTDPAEPPEPAEPESPTVHQNQKARDSA